MLKEYIPYYKSIGRLALPVIISQVGSMSVGLADTFMVGKIGTKPLAAVAFANSLSWVVYLFGMGIAMGLTPLVGRAYARKDRERLGSLLRNSFLLNVGLGVIFTVIIMGLSLAMPWMKQDPEILPYAKDYILYQIFSVLPIMIFSTSKQFLEGIGNTAYSMWITITANLMNIGLNALLIYGYWDFPKMGAAGAGASTFIARCYMVVIFLLLMYNKKSYRIYLRLAWKSTFNKFRVRRLLNLGIPIAGQLSIEMAAISFMAIIIGTFTSEALAGHQIAINIPSMSFMVVTGLSAATTILVSRHYALRLYGDVRMILKAALQMVTLYMILSAIAIVIFAVPIATVFEPEPPDPLVVKMAAYLMIFGAFFQLSDGIQGVTVGALRGLMQVKKPMLYAITTYLTLIPALSYLFGFIFGIGPAGPWLAFTFALSLLAFLYLRLFRKTMQNLK